MEIQLEERPFSMEELMQMLDLGRRGIEEIIRLQKISLGNLNELVVEKQ